MKMLKCILAAVCVLGMTAHAQEDILQENDFLDMPEDSGMMPENTENPGNPGSPNDAGAFNPSNTPALSPGAANPAFRGTKKRNRKAPPISQAGIEDITNENYPDLIDSFDFPNADIADVIKAISELTGKNFIVDPSVSGKITIMAPTQITVAEAYKVFLSSLAIRGFTIVPSGKFLKILPVRDAQRENIEIFAGAYTPDSDQLITRIIHLKYIPASEMNKFTSKLISKNGNIDIYEPTNSLIVSDQASSVQRLIKIIGQLDVMGFEEQMAVIPIRYAKAKDIADLIEQIINKGSKKQTSSIPRFRPGGQQQSSSSSAFSTVIPDDRTNAIIVVGNKTGIEKIRSLVKRLDFKLNPDDAGGAFVYYVKHGEAEKIADILNGIAKSLKDDQQKSGIPIIPPPSFGDGFGGPPMGMPAANAPSSTGLFGADVKISADKDTNALIIVGNKQDYQAVLNLLKKIDIARDQVYVETIIMEMSVADTNNFGISYYNFVKGTDGLGRVGFGGGNIGTLTGIGSEGGILGFASGESVKINVSGKEFNVKSMLGFLNLLKTNTKTNILATPQVIAMDNEEATVEVGEEIPVALNSVAATGGGVSQNVERIKATIKLVIKPFISPSSETVRMNIKQIIKQLNNKAIEGAPELSKISRSTVDREITTNIVVRDGDTAVLGGLMRDEESSETRKIPLLGDIPVLGWLFKSTSKTVDKKNLLVFITPRVLRTPEDSKRLVSRKLDERVKYVKDSFGGNDPHGAKVEELRPKTEAQAPQEPLEDNFDQQ